MMRCLDAVLAQQYERFDVLVLDNCSSDGTAEACGERAAHADVPIRVEVMPGSVGLLRNRAAELSDADLLAFTDSDCMPAPQWLAEGVAAFEGRPEVGLVQGKTLPEPDKEFRGWTASIEVTEPSGRFESCNLLVRRDAFAASDGFDEEIGHFWEDTAAGWSMLRQGWTAGFAANAVVYHDVTYPGFAWFLRRAQRYGNVAAVVRRYPELRREVLWGRIFLRPRNAKVFAAVAGVALSPLDRRALVLALPYLRYRNPGTLNPWAVKAQAEGALFDLSILVGMLRGSLRHRSLVL
jgi:GT2 family glycosyltransferase